MIAKLQCLGAVRLHEGVATVIIEEEGLPTLQLILKRALNTMGDIPTGVLDLADFLDTHLQNKTKAE